MTAVSTIAAAASAYFAYRAVVETRRLRDLENRAIFFRDYILAPITDAVDRLINVAGPPLEQCTNAGEPGSLFPVELAKRNAQSAASIFEEAFYSLREKLYFSQYVWPAASLWNDIANQLESMQDSVMEALGAMSVTGTPPKKVLGETLRQYCAGIVHSLYRYHTRVHALEEQSASESRVRIPRN